MVPGGLADAQASLYHSQPTVPCTGLQLPVQMVQALLVLQLDLGHTNSEIPEEASDAALSPPGSP